MIGALWYICLAVIGLVCIAITLYKKRNTVELISFYLCATSFAFLGEYFILGVFQAYSYKPGILADPSADSLAGHLICNMTLYGGLAVLVAAFSLRYYWILLISVLFMAVEFLFLKMGIYEVRWWSTYMTGIVAFIYFFSVKLWFSELKKGKNKVLRFFALYFTALSFIHFLPAILLPIGKQHYRPGWFDDLYRDSSMFAYAYHSGIALVITALILILKKWYWKVLAIIFSFLCNSLLVKKDVLIFTNGWNFLFLTLVQIIGLLIFILLDKKIFRLKGD